MRGFTLYELMIVTVIVGALATIFGSMAASMHRTDRLTAAYVEDLSDIRHAVRTLERDLREASNVEGLDYRLEGGILLRDGRPLARNIASFELAQTGALATARLRLKQRSEVDTGRRPEVTTRVFLRNHREAAK